MLLLFHGRNTEWMLQGFEYLECLLLHRLVSEKWNKIFKKRPSENCKRQPLKNFTWSILECFVLNGDFRILSNRIISQLSYHMFSSSNKSLNIVLGRYLNCFTSFTPSFSSTSNKGFSLKCAISSLENHCRQWRLFLYLIIISFHHLFNVIFS